MQKITTWHQTKPGLLTFGLVEAALAYAFVFWAVDSGSLLDWLCVLVLVIGVAQNFVKLVYRSFHRV